MRQRALLLCVCTAAIACDSNPTGPEAAAGTYELVAANGQPLPIGFPPTSIGSQFAVLASGDLILRRDGTFGMGFQRGAGWLTGQWRVNGEIIEFSSNSSATITAESAGDSLVVSGGSHFWSGARLTFRRIRGVTPMTGRYALTSVMDHSDLTYVNQALWHRVNYDSIWFLDELFFKRRRSEEAGTVAAGLDHPWSSQGYQTYGSYRRVGSKTLILRTYIPTAPLADTLNVVENRLERDLWREVYTAY